jgi:NADH-quinone oxidoreductase subunit J
MNLEDVLLYFFTGSALFAATLMLVARHPMRVALALISTMLSLAGVYALLGVHVVAVFQVLIYVGAVMVFMVYVIMLLDVRDPSFLRRYGNGLVPGIVLGLLLLGVLMAATTQVTGGQPAAAGGVPSYLVQPFSAEFVQNYWLHFELTSVLLLAAVVAAIAVIKSGGRRDG